MTPSGGPASSAGRVPRAGGGLAALLLLADGRLPAGGHAHGGGIEAAVADGRVASVDDLARYLEGRATTTGRVDAALAVAARTWALDPAGTGPAGTGPAGTGPAVLDAEVAARMVSPALRAASRAQGRGLLRVARRCWSSPALDLLARDHPDGPHQVVVLGAAAAAAGVDAAGVAATAAWAAVGPPAWAAVRLLGLDPVAVTALLARLAPVLDDIAAEATAATGDGRAWEGLAAAGAPLTEIAAESHAAWEVRLFAS